MGFKKQSRKSANKGGEPLTLNFEKKFGGPKTGLFMARKTMTGFFIISLANYK